MFKKAVLVVVALLALSFGTAFADQIDGLASLSGPAGVTNVYVNPGGLGQALIYGYYNVRGNKNTIFTVTNTDTSNGARVRIRFREAATILGDASGNSICNGSQEVLDFDICLSKGDVWTGQIGSDANGAALLTSTDTDTYIQASPSTGTSGGLGSAFNPAVIFPTAFPSGVEFKFGSANSLSVITADQTREGYFEIISEDQLGSSCSTASTCGTGTNPACCTCGDLVDTAIPVNNALMGHAYNIDFGTSETFSYAATALADWTSSDQTAPIGSPQPVLSNGDDGLVGVEYVLSKSNLKSIYDVETSVNGKTQLIVTFPTKILRHTGVFNSTTGKCEVCPTNANDSCDIFDDPRVLVSVFDTAENSPTVTCQFSPCPSGSEVQLPNEVNIVDIDNSNIFTTDVKQEIATPAGFDFGWINIDLTDAVTSPPNPPHETIIGTAIVSGLPAIGYNVMSFAGNDFSGLMPLQYNQVGAIMR